MRRIIAVGLAAGLLSALAIGAAQARDDGAESANHIRGVRGNFAFQGMMHTARGGNRLPGVNPWDGRSSGRFAYRSIPCSGNAPVNNLSSNLPSYNSRVRGSRSPSSTRIHPLRFSVVRSKSGRREMRGRITLTVCKLDQGPTADPDPVPDVAKPKIRILFSAPFRRENTDVVRFNGRFRITSGTQRYDDLTGSGTIAGYLFCYDQGGCASQGGHYQDGQLSMQGSYADPTPELAAG